MDSSSLKAPATASFPAYPGAHSPLPLSFLGGSSRACERRQNGEPLAAPGELVRGTASRDARFCSAAPRLCALLDHPPAPALSTLALQRMAGGAMGRGEYTGGYAWHDLTNPA